MRYISLDVLRKPTLVDMFIQDSHDDPGSLTRVIFSTK